MLAEIGFVSSSSNPCIIIYTFQKEILLVYIDDLILAGAKTALTKIVSHLKQHFQVSDKGPLNWFLQIEFTKTEIVFILSQ